MLIRLFVFGVLSAVVSTVVGAAETPPRLWYAQPAAIWNEALPLGSGRLGAMVFGGVVDERIQFNEDTLWTGKPNDYARPGASKFLPELRALVGKGETKAAEALARKEFLGNPVRQKAYQPFGDLRLRFEGHEKFSDYRRELDLDAAAARVSYRVGEVVYAREVFASHPDGVVVVRLSADRPASLTLNVGLSTPHALAEVLGAAGDTISFRGRVAADGLGFEARARVIATGGKVEPRGASLAVVGADAVTVLIAARTSFRNYEAIDGDPAALCAADLARAAGKSVEALRAAQAADHQRLFRRVGIDLGTSEKASWPTDRRLKDVKTAGLESDPALASLYFNYGRYLLIASSRPGTQPANLQGIWNELLDPPWESKWTTNINVEMNYWPAEVANLSECHEPLFDLIDDLVVSGKRSARAYYDCDGWVLHHNTDLWRGTAPVNNIDGVWPTGGAWLCYHLWEHYLFTGDKAFLARRAYPAMREAARFFTQYLVADAKTGWLVTTPSYSPEQGSLTAGPAMDMQLVRALFDSTIEAAGLLKTDAEFAGKLVELRARLAPNLIGRHGQLQEWLDDVDVPNNAHRHMSPLWALYPGAEINAGEPKVFAAAKVLLGWRGGGNSLTGWSFAWRIPLWARVGNGNVAHRNLASILQRKTLPNLFDLCGPFQIDGNFGATAGIAEMLLQSHLRVGDAADGKFQIELLPALPGAWPTGAVRGLVARGGFEVDLAWRDGALTGATIRSKLGRACRLRRGDTVVELATTAGGTYAFDGRLTVLP